MNPLLFGPIFEIIKQVLGGLGLDPAIKEKAQAQALEVLSNGTFDQKAQQAINLAQIENNKEDSKGNAWQAGWRPLMGWACGVSLCYVWLLQPITSWVSTINGWPIPPTLDTMQQLSIVGQMLGLAAARSVEKIKGVA